MALRRLGITLQMSIALSVAFPIFARANDAEKIVEARVALEKHSDCATANQLLNSVSASTKTDLVWIYYSAQAKKCIGDIGSALTLMETYNSKVPNEPAITVQLAELRYLAKSSWRKGFCPSLKLAVEAYASGFGTIKGPSIATTSDGYVRTQSKIALPRVLYQNQQRPDEARPEVAAHPGSASRSYFWQQLYKGARPLPAEIVTDIKNEVRQCLGTLITFEELPYKEVRGLRGKATFGPSIHVYIFEWPIEKPSEPQTLEIYVGERQGAYEE